MLKTLRKQLSYIIRTSIKIILKAIFKLIKTFLKLLYKFIKRLIQKLFKSITDDSSSPSSLSIEMSEKKDIN